MSVRVSRVITDKALSASYAELVGVLVCALAQAAPKGHRVAWIVEHVGDFDEGTDYAVADFCSGSDPQARLMRLVSGVLDKRHKREAGIDL